MASSRADWVLGVARLISSARTIWLITGPARNSKLLLCWLKIETPVTSEGSRSGVNWMRRKLQPSDRASAFASTVLPVPGTSSTRMCPRHSSATMASSTSWCLPKMTRSTFSATPATRWLSPVLSNGRILPSNTAHPVPHGTGLLSLERSNGSHGSIGAVRGDGGPLFAENGAHHHATEGRRVDASLPGVLDDHRDRDLRILGRREAHEPAVGRAARVLGRAGLAGHVHAGDLRAERERPGRLDGRDQIAGQLGCGVGPDDLVARPAADDPQ